MRISLSSAKSLAVFVLMILHSVAVLAQSRSDIVVPGTGVQLNQVGDDFEDETWDFIPNNPKSTEDIDENQRQPMGKSTNGRWYEGAKRGHPDVVKRVPTPPGGIPGSQGSMLMKSLYTGIPNRPSHKMHQDDFICNVQYRLGGTLKVSQSPNITTRASPIAFAISCISVVSTLNGSIDCICFADARTNCSGSVWLNVLTGRIKPASVEKSSILTINDIRCLIIKHYSIIISK